MSFIILVGMRCPESGDFDDFSTKPGVNNLETFTNDPRISKEIPDCLWVSVGRYIKVFWNST